MAVIHSPARGFCEALAEESRGRRNWWVSIQKIADRLGIGMDEATVLADDCAQAGYVVHDQSQATKPSRRATQLPHSVSLADVGWELLQPKKKRT